MNGVFCADCAARPEVDYLDAYKREHWGKRDSWAWLLGLTGLASAATSAFLLTTIDLDEPLLTGPLPWLVFTALYAVIGVAFWRRVQLARRGLFFIVAPLGVALAVSLGPMSVTLLGIPIIAATMALRSTRTKLFFQMEVPVAALEAAWSHQHDNPLARRALSLGLWSLLMPLFAPLAAVMGIIGLRRVRPDARPPIGGRRESLGGLVLGLGVTLYWAVSIGIKAWAEFQQRRH